MLRSLVFTALLELSQTFRGLSGEHGAAVVTACVRDVADGPAWWSNTDRPNTFLAVQDWITTPTGQAALACAEFAEDGTCIHSDHMAMAGL